MKKILIITLLAIGLTLPAQAAIISYDVLSGDSGVSYSHFNTSFSRIYDEFNGSISSANILNDSLDEADFADAINPRVRTDENIGDYTYTGMLPVTSTDLTSNISAGTSYVNGYRIVTDATSKTYTASVDTWVYIDQNGAFQYSEVATGAAQPTTPSNSLLLAQVVCDGDNITSVVDKRTTTPPGLRIYQDLILGAVISRDITTATTINIGKGTIDFGSGIALRRNTLTADIVFTSTGRGGLDTGSLAQGYYAIWAVPDDANATNYEGVASTSFSATSLSITGERLIGWCYAPTSSAISPDSVGGYKGLGSSQPNISRFQDKTTVSTTSTTYTDLLEIKFYSSGRPVLINSDLAVNNSGASGMYAVISVDTIGYDSSERGFFTGGGSATVPAGTMSPSAIINVGKGQHSIKIRWRVAGNTGYIFGKTVTVQEL
uniref:Uncharacterized protein n=1 Tax=viral metagenome TaxID=1070528 RepID=A0A6M3J6Z3_9ZZZZ